MAFLVLLLSGIAEVFMVFCLRKAEGFSQKKWTLPVIFFAATSLFLLSQAMKTMEAGISYGIWVGMGSVGSLALGSMLFGEKLNRKTLVNIAVIIVSIIGLKVS